VLYFRGKSRDFSKDFDRVHYMLCFAEFSAASQNGSPSKLRQRVLESEIRREIFPRNIVGLVRHQLLSDFARLLHVAERVTDVISTLS
jgi:hypothetical protein